MAFWQSHMCWLATTAPPPHLQCKALTRASLPSTYWVTLNFQALHYLWDHLLALKFDQNWPGIFKSNCRATNTWADWCHEQKKSYSRIFTFLLHYTTYFWHYLLPEENKPCIFTCSAFCYFSMQLSYRNTDIVIFSSKVKEETCRIVS